MRKYGKSMFEILSEMNEATFTYDFFDANKPMSQIQADGRKYRVKLKVNKGKGSMGADEVVITGNEQDIVKYAQAHLDAGKRVRNLRDLKKDLNASYHDEETNLEEKVTAVYTDKKTRKVMSLKFKDRKSANDFFRNNKIAAGQINFREEVEDLEEFTDKQIERLRKEYESLRGKETGINPEKFKKLRGMMKRFPKANLLKLVKADIPVLTTGAKAALVLYHGMKYKQLPEELVPYIDIFADDTLDEQKGKFKSVDPKVIDRIEKLMRGTRAEKDSIANMLNYFMPPEVVDMVRYKLKIVPKRGKIKF